MMNTFRFDIRVKLILILGVNLLLLVSQSLILEFVLFSFSVLILAIADNRRSAIRFVIAFLIMLYVDRCLSGYFSGFYFTIISFIAFALRKFLPCLILGKWILDTTEVADFVASMWKIHMPLSAIIPLSVVFRYFPTIKEEWASIRAAMKIRGINFSIEHIMVPLLFSAVNVSEELSAAALCRGLDAPGEHSSYVEVKFRICDYVVLCIFAVIVVAVVALKILGII